MASGRFDQTRLFLNAYPDAVRHADERVMVPMQITLIHSADLDVMQLLIEFFPPAPEYPFLPRPPISEDVVPLAGLLPLHIACCRTYSLHVIFQLLLEHPGCVSGARCMGKSLRKLWL